jgi:hypothetical protein
MSIAHGLSSEVAAAVLAGKGGGVPLGAGGRAEEVVLGVPDAHRRSSSPA